MKDEQKSVTVSAKIKPATKKKLESKAKKRKRKLGYIINEILENNS